MFKPYQAVMVLSLRVDGNYYDTKGTYIKEMTMGSQKGRHKVEVNTVVIYKDLSDLMDYEEYFKLYNENKDGLPGNASRKLQFLEGDWRG